MNTKRSNCLKAVIASGVIMAGFAASPALAGGGAKDGSVKGHHYPAHIVGVFTGVAINGTTEFAYGAEYEYRFNKMFGAGALFERTPEGHGSDGINVYMATAFIHPAGGLRLMGGIGRETIGGTSGSKPIYRIGAAYDIEMGKYAIAPTVNLDFVNGDEVVVTGLTFLRHF